MAKAFVIPAIFEAVDKFSAPVKKMEGQLSAFANRAERDFRNAGQSAFAMSKSAAVAGIAIAAPLILAGKAAVDFEDKMSDVAKTTGLSGDKLEKMGQSILDLSKTTRTSIDDLVKIAEIGGQLGIAEKDLVSFTKASDQFNIALGKDFSGGVEEAVSTVGKIKGLFADTRNLNIADSIMKTGSAINELGAVGAGTSFNISDFTLRLGALPDALKPSIQNTLALGTYLEELGVDAQIGAGGVTNLLLVAGKNIDKFAKQMGTSSVEAKSLLAQDPLAFANKFSQGFKGMAPEKMAKALADLGVGSQETIKVMGALSSDYVRQETGLSRLAELQNVANASFKEGNSLSAEAGKKNETMAAKMAILQNNAKSLAITMGNALLPVLNNIVESVTPFIKKISDWIGRNKSLVSTIVKVAVGAAGLAFAISGISLAIGIYQKAVAIAKIVQMAWNMALLANPIGLVVLAVGALAVGVMALNKVMKSGTAAERVNAEVRERALENTIDQRVEVTLLFQALRKTTAGTEEYNSVLEKINAIQPGIVDKYNLQAKAVQNINAAERELIQSIMKRAEVEARAELLREKTKQLITQQSEGPGFLNKVLGATSNGMTAEMFQAMENAQLQSEINALAEQTANATPIVNPKAAQQEAITKNINTNNKETLDINVYAPEGTQVKSSGNNLNRVIPFVGSTKK